MNNTNRSYGLPKVKTAKGDYVVTVLLDDMVTFSRVDVAFNQVTFNNGEDQAAAFAKVEAMTDPKTFYSRFNGQLNVTFNK